MDLSSWGEGARLICRRERPHPGAQLSLVRHLRGLPPHVLHHERDRRTSDVAVLELRHRGHARVEDRVRNWKDCGLTEPAVRRASPRTWPGWPLSLVAGALLAWAQMACFDGELEKAEPKTLRYRILHVAAVLVRRGRRLILRLDETWPWALALKRAFLQAAIDLPITSRVPAPDPTTVSLPGGVTSDESTDL